MPHTGQYRSRPLSELGSNICRSCGVVTTSEPFSSLASTSGTAAPLGSGRESAWMNEMIDAAAWPAPSAESLLRSRGAVPSALSRAASIGAESVWMECHTPITLDNDCCHFARTPAPPAFVSTPLSYDRARSSGAGGAAGTLVSSRAVPGLDSSPSCCALEPMAVLARARDGRAGTMLATDSMDGDAAMQNARKRPRKLALRASSRNTARRAWERAFCARLYFFSSAAASSASPPLVSSAPAAAAAAALRSAAASASAFFSAALASSLALSLACSTSLRRMATMFLGKWASAPGSGASSSASPSLGACATNTCA